MAEYTDDWKTRKRQNVFTLFITVILWYKVFPEIYKITSEGGDIFKELAQDFCHNLPKKHSRHFSSKSSEEMFSTVKERRGEKWQ